METCISKGNTGKFFYSFVLILTKGDALFQDAVIFEAGVEISRVAAHVSNKIKHPGPDLRVGVMHQTFNVLVGVNTINMLINLFGMPGNLRKKVSALHEGG